MSSLSEAGLERRRPRRTSAAAATLVSDDPVNAGAGGLGVHRLRKLWRNSRISPRRGSTCIIHLGADTYDAIALPALRREQDRINSELEHVNTRIEIFRGDYAEARAGFELRRWSAPNGTVLKPHPRREIAAQTVQEGDSAVARTGLSEADHRPSRPERGGS